MTDSHTAQPALGDIPAEPANAYAWMDLFRTVAAVLVAASHLRDLLWRDAAAGDGVLYSIFYLMTGFGHIGVIVFFVLSGFWITRSVIRRADRPTFWTEYLIDRLSRLWIVLVPVLAIGGLLDWLGATNWQFANYIGESGAHSIAGPVSQRLGIPQLLGSALFLADVAVEPLGSNGPLWSLAYEFWYYVWFPALYLLVARRRFSLALLALGIGLLAPNLAFGFVSWLAGTVLVFALRGPQRPARVSGVGDKAALFLSLGLAVGMMLAGRILHSVWLDPVVATAFAIFLYWLCRVDLPFPRWLRPLATFGSGSSYSLYALHFPLAMALCGWFSGGARLEPSGQLFAMTLVLLAIIIAVAFVFSRLTEARTGALRAALRKRLLPNGDSVRDGASA